MGIKNCVITLAALVTFFCLSVFPSCSSQAETSAQLSDPTTKISDTAIVDDDSEDDSKDDSEDESEQGGEGDAPVIVDDNSEEGDAPVTMQATDGTTIAFDDFRGKETVLWFWAPT